MAHEFNPLSDLGDSLRKVGGCRRHAALERSASPDNAAHWWELIQECSERARIEHLRWFGLNDLFFLCVYLLNRKHFIQDDRKARWTFEFCNDVQIDPFNNLDIAPREHFKSEIITFGSHVQHILRDSNETLGIFSHVRPLAKQHLRLMKTEFETNELLKTVFSNVLWRHPKQQSPKWSEDEGLVLKRTSNRKESTVEAYGLVDGQPTSKRFTLLGFDDTVARDSISPEMTLKTKEEFYNALLLTASDPVRFTYCATFQEIGDATQQLIDDGFGKLRKRGPLDANGRPACWSDEKFADFQNKLPPKIFALQVLVDPTQARADEHIGFEESWLKFYKDDPPLRSMNIYVVVDPAGKSKDSNSRFALWVVGLLAPKSIYILDGVLDKLDLGERADVVFAAHRKYNPLKVGYETYQIKADIDYLHKKMEQEHYSFTLVELGGHDLSKDQRIELLIPEFRSGNIFLPARGIEYHTTDGKRIDLVKTFIDMEYSRFPWATKQKDLLDAMARVKDPKLGVLYPRSYGSTTNATGDPWSRGANVGSGGWMSE